MHSFVNGTSTAVRKDNWALVQKACRRNEFELPKDVVTACQAERSGAANTMLEVLYEHLTQKQIRRPEEVRLPRLSCISSLSMHHKHCSLQLDHG